MFFFVIEAFGTNAQPASSGCSTQRVWDYPNKHFATQKWHLYILQGMMRFVALYQGEYDPERLVKRLHTVHPMTLVRDEKSLSGTVRYKYMMLILRTYNGASRRRNLPIKP